MFSNGLKPSCGRGLFLESWRHMCCTVLCLVAQSCLTLCDAMDHSPPGSSVHGDSPGKNTEVSCHALLQGIFPTQASNPGLLYCRQILYHLNHLESPTLLQLSNGFLTSTPLQKLVLSKHQLCIPVSKGNLPGALFYSCFVGQFPL